jgi:hypothetical protein
MSGCFKTVGLAVVAAIAVAAGGCSGSNGSPPGPSCNTPSAPTQLYPISGTKGVATRLNIMVFAGYNGGIILSRFASGSPYINTQPTAVPSPLPSPAAMPPSGQTPFAVSLPALRAHSKYTAYTFMSSAPCITPPIGNNAVKIGTFTTQ